MIDLYTFPTPNGKKPAIMLEEIVLPYTVHKVDITKGEQFAPEYIAINPNSKIPAIVDRSNDLSIFESGAILIYLAEKTGKLLPTDIKGKTQVIEWLMFQMGGIGPMFGQLGHFLRFAPEKIPYAIERYEKETLRLLGVLERQLEQKEYIAGDYSIADIATYPWIKGLEFYQFKLDMEKFPSLNRWINTLAQRQAVQKGMAVLG